MVWQSRRSKEERSEPVGCHEQGGTKSGVNAHHRAKGLFCALDSLTQA